MKARLLECKVLICIGTGGVGKTTVSAALGAWAAQLGRKVLVLTIDPSQRLKTTLGLGESGELKQLVDPLLKGELWASVIENKKTFDEFVLRSSPSPEAAEKILQNRLYQQLSTTLSGSQEFTALESLFAAFESEKYDLIILDTPPAEHALDFFDAPEKLRALFQDKITRWFRSDVEGAGSGRLKLWSFLQLGTKQVLKVLETLTGSEFIGELNDFFSAISSWQGRLEARTRKSSELLRSPTTQFVLVCSHDRAHAERARSFATQIQQRGLVLCSVIFNRSLPVWALEDLAAAEGPAFELASRWKEFLMEKKQKMRMTMKFDSSRTEVLDLPDLQEDVRSLEDIFQVVNWMKRL